MRLEIRKRNGAFEVIDMEASRSDLVKGRFGTRPEAREHVRSLMFPGSAREVPPRPPVVEPEIKTIKPLAVKTAPPKKARRVKRSKPKKQK